MKKNIIIFGSGNHSKVVLDVINEKKDLNLLSIINLNNFNNFKKIYKNKKGNLYGHIAIGSNYLRKKVYNQLSKSFPKLKFLTLKSKTAIISKETKIGDGCLIMPGAIINTKTRLGINCLINTGSIIEHDNFFDDFSSSGPGVMTGGNVKIGKLSHLGIGSVVLNNCKVDSNTIIGANSTVLKNCSKNSVYIGSPSKKIKSRKISDNYL